MKEIVWCCRYCKKENMSKEIYFLESNTKILLDKNSKNRSNYSAERLSSSDTVVSGRH